MSKKLDEATKRLIEEELYAVVVDELKNNVIREGLMAKALVETSGDKEQARLIYIQYRIQSMLDEAAIIEAEKEAAEAKRREEVEKKADALLRENEAKRREESKNIAANEKIDYFEWHNRREKTYRGPQNPPERPEPVWKQFLAATGVLIALAYIYAIITDH